MMNFSSENFDMTHTRVIQALVQANEDFVPSYGNDKYTLEAVEVIKKLFGEEQMSVFFCFNGTGANSFALSAVTERYQSIFCSEVSHVFTAESTAPEALTGCRIIPLKSENGKIVPEDFLSRLKKTKDIHLPVPRVLTLTQPTEYGTVYSLKELEELGRCCKENNILIHIDGARICNALVALNCTFKEFVEASGADVLTLGGTKLGLMFGEAVIFFRNGRFKNIEYIHKRSMQLASKNRFIAAQFLELFKDDLWSELARYGNELAKYFEEEITKIDDSVIAYPVETNVAFLKMPGWKFEKLKTAANFYLWDYQKEEARFVFSFSNTKKEIDLFIGKYSEYSRV